MIRQGTYQPRSGLLNRIYIIIFEADTRAGKLFDTVLIACILISVTIVILDSVASLRAQYGYYFDIAEWVFTIIFTIEYILRLMCVTRPLRYAFSFYGIIDLLSILPSYLSIILPPGQYLVDVRILRLLRVFRVFKLGEYIGEADTIMDALHASRRKITVFISAVLMAVVVLGTLMYVIEGEENGFTSIPVSVYWAIVTLTTVGYGDISPQTPLGQMIASMVMMMGYGILAVPTGIVTAEFNRAYHSNGSTTVTTRTCTSCFSEGHERSASYCKDCGEVLER